VTIADMVAAQRLLMDRLGIERLFAVAGGSMGAMQALQWTVDTPERVANCLFLAATPRSSTQNIAFNEIGRQAIYADPRWNRGDYYGADREAPEAGLAVARMVGHITYMSERSLESKFGRTLQGHNQLPYTFLAPEFTVESYLQHQGEKFVQRFDANSYLYITKALDYFDIQEDYPTMADSLRRTSPDTKFLVVSFSSDWLYTAAQAQELVNALHTAARTVRHHEVIAEFGHDSFLVEVETMTHLVGGYLDEQWTLRGASIAAD
jgi:homoserine O-acetyltransferase